MNSTLTKFLIYILILFGLLSNFSAYSLNQDELYSKESISNYFSGLVSFNNNNNKLALNYLNNLTQLKNIHNQFNYELIFTLIQLQKFEKTFAYLKKLDEKNINFFEANLLLSIDSFLNKKYKKSINYLNFIIKQNKFSNFEKLIARTLFNYIKVFENKSYDFENILSQTSSNYKNFIKVQTVFLNCYLENENVDVKFLELINANKLNYSRYNFFYINFLLSKKRNMETQKILDDNISILNENLLLVQTRSWMQEGKLNRIKEIFDCRKQKHLISEFFYLIANLYSTENEYKLSNFYLNLSMYLNPDFIFNNALLAENYIFLKDYKNSKKIYSKFNSRHKVYNWYAKKRITFLKEKVESVESAIDFLINSFNKLENPTAENYYDLGNYYKDFKKYEKSIEYYTKALNKISSDHQIYSKILHRRGMSYERLKMWKKSEDDLMESLRLVPNEPYVLNYLAYSWLERNINIDKSIEMLEIALESKKGDPYIIDSLGWGFYLVGKYHEAEKLLQKAVELMPEDPIVNDHYADILWKLNKNLQANYFWNYVLNLKTTENKMKNKIKEKLIFGIQNNS